jgi:hypothetical protein
MTGSHSEKKPKEVGYVVDYINHEAQRFEDKWQEAERQLDLIYTAYGNQTLHLDPVAIDAAKNLIALHAARSRTMINVLNHVRDRVRHHLTAELIKNEPERLAQSFYERTGLHAVGSEAILYQAELEAAKAADTTETGKFVGWRVETNYDDLRQLLSRTSIQVLVASPSSRRFIIGDDPSPSMKASYKGLGPLGGVPWPEATTIGLPMSPDFSIALKNSPELIEIDDHQVALLNMVQFSNAESSVFYRPNRALRENAIDLMQQKVDQLNSPQKYLLS